jgi:hypothetical protein
MKTEEHVVLTGFAEPDTRVTMSIKTRGGEITFIAGENFCYGLTSPIKSGGGITMGDANRQWLHEHLDKWIDDNIERTK